MSRIIINTPSAPAAIGPYAQAVRSGNTLYLSGQVPLDPVTGTLVEGDIREQANRIFDNIAAVCLAAGGSLDSLVRVGIYLTDLSLFAQVNEVMAQRLAEPYPARSTIGVTALPLGAAIEMDAIAVLD